MMRLALGLVALMSLAVALPAHAFDPNLTFQKGTWIVSFEGGGGKQNDLENHGRQSDIELFAAAGGTNLKVMEINSSFAFWLAGGLGASYFVTDNVALYAGYRMVHV